MIVAIDCDGVLINTIFQFLEWRFPRESNDEILARYNALEHYDDVTKHYGLIELFRFLECYATNLRPVPGALSVLTRIRATGARLVCVTAPPPLSVAAERYERRRRIWLHDVGGFAEHDIIFAPGDAKALIAADVFIDDHYRTVERWNRTAHVGYMVASPWNRDPSMRKGPHETIELNELDKVLEYVEKAMRR